MAIGSVMGIGVGGIQQSQRAMAESAQEIASAAVAPEGAPSERVSPDTLVEPLLALRQSQQVFDASAKVVQVGADTLGSLLDIQA